MTSGTRKAVGMAVLCLVMLVYIAVLVVIADYVPDHWVAQLVFFAIAGVAWALPLRGLLRWINRPGDEDAAGR